MLSEKLVKGFIDKAKADVKKELLEELGDLITEKYSALEEKIDDMLLKLEKVKPDSGWF
jgi:hypothetical protein